MSFDILLEEKKTMKDSIPQSEINNLLLSIKTAMEKKGFSSAVIRDTKIVEIHPENWEISLLVPCQHISIRKARKAIEKILFTECGVEDRCCDYLGKQPEFNAYEWYFRHPQTPEDIYNRLDQKIEQELGEEEGWGLPQPSGFKSNSDIVFLTLREDFFEKIKRGEKKTEYRTLNQYYCDKFFSVGVPKKYVKFNKGYSSGVENQMLLEIEGFVLVDEHGNEVPVYDKKGSLIVSYKQLPRNFAPACYGIKLGQRILL